MIFSRATMARRYAPGIFWYSMHWPSMRYRIIVSFAAPYGSTWMSDARALYASTMTWLASRTTVESFSSTSPPIASSIFSGASSVRSSPIRSLIESFGARSPDAAARKVAMSLRSPTANRMRWRGRSWLMLSTLPRS